jgi:16S rRNA (cytosine1402-N4)-methyltransferase
MTEPFVHRPVMVDEIVDVFRAVPPGVVLDATLGGGGHTEALLDSRDDLMVIGIDRDPAALAAATARLERFGGRFRAVHARFDDLHQLMPTDQIPRPTQDQIDDIDAALRDGLSGALFDLGVSSPQLDRPERGFSFRNDGPLDMRMDTTAAWSAADVVNGYPEDELARIIRRYGDERFATRIARAIVAARPIETTAELAAVVTTAIPAATRRTGGHPATRTFQAIRIEVNGELDALPTAIDAAIEATRPGGRIAVLSYHSGEDRIVKDRLRTATGACDCPPGLPCVCDAVQTVRLVRRVAKRASAAEQADNPRAASARLRAAVKT